MSGKAAVLPDGIRLSDLMSVMVLGRVFPIERVKVILTETGRSGLRERNLPAYLMVYYVIALWLYRQASYQEVLRCIFETFNWVNRDSEPISVSCKAAIFKARDRLGPEPLKRLCVELVKPIGTEKTRGAFWRGWRLISLDGSTLDIGDTNANSEHFGRPAVSRGDGSAYPQLRFCSLLENGTHVLFGTAMGPYSTGEITLATDVITNLERGMLCLADRNFYGFELWTKAAATGADLVWRIKSNAVLPCVSRLADGSFLSTIYPTTKDRRRSENGVTVRIVEYSLANGSDNDDETTYRLMTTILDHERAPALELAELYGRRWEIETTLDEFKTHLGGNALVLRSKTPEGVNQEFWGFVLAHHAVRAIMHDAAQKVDAAPNELSYTHAVNEVRRKLPYFLVTPPTDVEENVRPTAN